MKKVTLQEIFEQSKCPNKRFYSIKYKNKVVNTISKDEFIVRNIIKKCFVSSNTKNFYQSIQWNTVKNEIDKACFADIDINDKEQFDKEYNRSVSLRQKLHSFYYDYFVDETRDAICNLDTSFDIKDVRVSISIDLVLFDTENLIPVIFIEDGINPEHLSNSLKIKGKCLSLYKNSGYWPDQIGIINIIENKIKITFIKNNCSLKEIDDAMSILAMSVGANIRYPSVSEQCEVCDFKKICGL